MNQVVLILEYTVVAAILVLLVTNGDKVANIISTFGSFWLGETKTLTGTGYVLPK